MEICLSAPGKLFLSGEYAVLWGGTARLAGVGPRAFALGRTREDREVHLVLAQGRLVGTVTPLGVRWASEPGPAFGFAARALDVVVRARARESLGLELALSPTAPGPGGHKLGLGSSARAVVLAVEAAARLLDVRPPLALAMLAHAEAQGGKGSGGDVAASSVGGLLRYRRWPLERVTSAPSLSLGLAAAGAPDVVRLGTTALPASYAFSGQSASTRGMIQRAEAALAGADRQRFVESSDELGRELEDGLRASRFAQVDEACRALEQLLESLPGVATPGTTRILALARTAGSTGKVSGAGGGDGCVLFSPDEESRRALLAALGHRGFVAVPLPLEGGVRAESAAPPELRAWLTA
ncbi:MAG TPA: phosphomevalonate kinase [Myxococcaceae bacterium]